MDIVDLVDIAGLVDIGTVVDTAEELGNRDVVAQHTAHG